MALLSWLVLLVALVGALAAAGTSFSSSQTSQNSESATASALLQRASAAGGGNSGDVVWQATSGTVTTASVKTEMSGLLDRIAADPAVASVTSPYNSAGVGQLSSDKTVAYAVVQFDRGATKAEQSAVQSQALAKDTASVTSRWAARRSRARPPRAVRPTSSASCLPS